MIRDLFFKNLSERAAKMLRDDMEQLGPIKLREVDEAQASIVLVAKELASSGRSRSIRPATTTWSTSI